MDVERLAGLASIELTVQEKESLARDLGSIIAYVSELSSVTVPDAITVPHGGSPASIGGASANTMREDRDAHEPGIFSEALLAMAPRAKGGAISVKKIITK